MLRRLLELWYVTYAYCITKPSICGFLVSMLIDTYKFQLIFFLMTALILLPVGQASGMAFCDTIPSWKNCHLFINGDA